jgi:hypothetical protein
MRKVFSNGRVRPLCLALLLVSSQAIAAYSDDPDCSAVSNGAADSARRELGRLEDTATRTGASIQQAKSCVDEVLAQANRAVADFGGGVLAGFASQLLAKQGCQMLGQAQTALSGQINGALPPGAASAIGQINGSLSTGGIAPVPAAQPSIWQRLVNIF